MQFLHTMIRAKDEKESTKFYCDFLGLKKGRRLRLEDSCLQYLYDDITKVEIELTINDSIPKEGYKNGSAFGHFAFLCENLDEVNKKMELFNYTWDVEPFYLAQINTRIAFLSDPDNNSIELIEKTKES